MCEKDKRKVEYLDARFDTDCATFIDAADLGKIHAETADGSTERVPKASFLKGKLYVVLIFKNKEV